MYFYFVMENLQIHYFILCLNLNFTYIVADVDGDDVRCRWAESSQGECAGVCRTFTSATLTGVRIVMW